MRRSACSSTEVGLRFGAEGGGFAGHINGCRYIKGLSWGVSCLQTNTKENQDGWSINALTTPVNESGRVKGMRLREAYQVASWNHETLARAPEQENRSAVAGARACDAVTFTVLDGHGVGGRYASAAVETTLDECFKELEHGCAGTSHPAFHNLIDFVIDVLGRSLERAQARIEKLNDDLFKDFGTTLVSVTLVNDVILTASCGDSTALLLAVPHNHAKAPLIVELGRRHHLTDEGEVARVQREGRGRIIIGDGGILRLIPASASYSLAKKSGLSINMSRSLGHVVFKNYGLSVEADYTFLTLGTLPKLLKETQAKAVPRAYYRLPPLDANGCKTLSVAYGSSGRRSTRAHDEGSAEAAADSASACSSETRVKPETRRKVIPADIFLLLLSDGVTDVFNSSCILDMIRKLDHPSDVTRFAQELTHAAQERRTKAGSRSDNCTCIAVHLSPNN